MVGPNRRAFGLALMALVTIGATLPSAQARPTAARFSLMLTDNCNDPANPTTGAPAGLCQVNNPNQPGGNNLHPMITARIRLVDDGIRLLGIGTGTGFIFGRSYVSLIYFNPAVQTCARFPANQAALTQNTANADNDFNSMFLGFWMVQPDGSGTFEVYPGKMSPVGNPVVGGVRGLPAYATVSIREAAGGFVGGQAAAVANNVAAGRDVPPNIFALRACGVLTPIA